MAVLKGFKTKTEAVLPQVYDNSLSYYEVLGKLVDRVNTLIDRIDNIKPVCDTVYNESEERIIIFEKEII